MCAGWKSSPKALLLSQVSREGKVQVKVTQLGVDECSTGLCCREIFQFAFCTQQWHKNPYKYGFPETRHGVPSALIWLLTRSWFVGTAKLTPFTLGVPHGHGLNLGQSCLLFFPLNIVVSGLDAQNCCDHLLIPKGWCQHTENGSEGTVRSKSGALTYCTCSLIIYWISYDAKKANFLVPSMFKSHGGGLRIGGLLILADLSILSYTSQIHSNVSQNISFLTNFCFLKCFSLWAIPFIGEFSF